MKVSTRSAAVLGVMLVWFAATSSAADFSGKYVSKSGKGTEYFLEVVQTESSINIVRIEGGKTIKNVCPLDGSEGEYVSSGGVPGKCKARFKGKNLVIESMVVTHPAGSAQTVRVQTTERWQLSSDTKTLTIKSESSFPDYPSEISAAVGGVTSFTERFTRADIP
jgi:hypothetical protein